MVLVIWEALPRFRALRMGAGVQHMMMKTICGVEPFFPGNLVCQVQWRDRIDDGSDLWIRLHNPVMIRVPLSDFLLQEDLKIQANFFARLRNTLVA